jgi:hypothetical protein
MEPAGLRVGFITIRSRESILRFSQAKSIVTAILKGIEEGMAARFPGFPDTGSIWITEISEHEVDSCARAFYLVGRLVVDRAYLQRTVII